MTFGSNPADGCNDFREALQAILDGAMLELPAQFQGHRIVCRECSDEYQAVITLNGVLDAPQVFVPSPGLTDRLVEAVVNDFPRVDRRRTVVRWLTVAVAAACLAFLMMNLTRKRDRLGTAPAPASDPEVAAREERLPPAISIDEKLADAGSALQSLSRRTTESTQRLLDVRPDPTAFKLPEAIGQPMEPASQSMEELRQGAISSLEPMTRSARRAFSMFVRDVAKAPNP